LSERERERERERPRLDLKDLKSIEVEEEGVEQSDGDASDRKN